MRARAGLGRIAWIGILALNGTLSAQADGPAARAGDGDRGAVHRVLEGFVLSPDGSPAQGAIVVSSAGGKTLTDARGAYWLELELPPGTESVPVTAVGTGARNLAASTCVGVGATSGTAWVDPLTLAVGASCSPSWLPTFGGFLGVDDTILALAVYDDGGGAALYAGGAFTMAGGV